MKIKMTTEVFMATEKRTLEVGKVYDLPESDAQPMIDAGYAVPA